jgi:hypothetical protein
MRVRYAGFGLEPVDDVDDDVETPRVPLRMQARNGNGEMQLAGSGSADQHGIALLDNKVAARQIADQRLVDRRAGEIEVVDLLGQRQFGDCHLVFDRARLFLGNFGAEQFADNACRLVPSLDSGRHHFVIGGAHAVKLEPGHQLENVSTLHQATRRRRS